MPPSPDESQALTEEPDLVICHFRGHVTADVMRRLYDVQLRFSEGKSRLFLLLDVHHLVDLTPEARRVVLEGPGGKGEIVPIAGCAFVGASFHIRVVGTMVFRAARVMRAMSAFPVRFCDTEPEARAFLDDLRLPA